MRIPWKSVVVAGILCLLLPVSLGAQTEGDAQTTGQISGTVRDEEGAGLAGVAVSLVGKSLPEPLTALTDAAGRYRFTSVPPGSYDLGCRLDGFAREERDGVSLAAGGTIIVTVTLRAAKHDPLALPVDTGSGRVITNDAKVTTSTREASPGDESASEDTTITTRADLAIRSSDSVDPVIAGTALSYTVTVTNGGPSDARGVVVAETLPAGVSFVASNGCGEDPGGDRSCTLGTIPAGSSRQYSVAMTVDSATTGALTHRASVSAETPEASPGDESTTEETAVDARADLVLTNRDSVDPVVAGLPLTYTVTVRNNGPSDARDVVVNGSLPAEVSFQSTSGCAEDDDPGGGVAACTLGTIAAGSSKEYEIAVRVRPDATGVITNRANVSSSTIEARPGDEAVPAGAAPAAVSGGVAPQELVEVAKAWARAWSDGRAEDYLAFYAAGFGPPGGAGRSEWEAARRSRVEGREWIEVKLSAFEGQLLGEDRGRVSFDQAYRSNAYNDDVRKTLELVREGGSWRILEERVE